MAARWAVLAGVWGMVGCSDQLLAKRLYPPEVAILTPGDGAEVWRGAPAEVSARVDDLYTDDISSSLSVVWSTDNGDIAGAGWSADGLALASWVPAQDGPARVSVLVVDADAQEARDAVSPVVVANARPAVELLAPEAGEVLRQDRSASLEAFAADDGGAPALRVAWSLDGAPLDGCDAETPDVQPHSPRAAEPRAPEVTRSPVAKEAVSHV